MPSMAEIIKESMPGLASAIEKNNERREKIIEKANFENVTLDERIKILKDDKRKFSEFENRILKHYGVNLDPNIKFIDIEQEKLREYFSILDKGKMDLFIGKDLKVSPGRPHGYFEEQGDCHVLKKRPVPILTNEFSEDRAENFLKKINLQLRNKGENKILKILEDMAYNYKYKLITYFDANPEFNNLESFRKGFKNWRFSAIIYSFGLDVDFKFVSLAAKYYWYFYNGEKYQMTAEEILEKALEENFELVPYSGFLEIDLKEMEENFQENDFSSKKYEYEYEDEEDDEEEIAFSTENFIKPSVLNEEKENQEKLQRSSLEIEGKNIFNDFEEVDKEIPFLTENFNKNSVLDEEIENYEKIQESPLKLEKKEVFNNIEKMDEELKKKNFIVRCGEENIGEVLEIFEFLSQRNSRLSFAVEKQQDEYVGGLIFQSHNYNIKKLRKFFSEKVSISFSDKTAFFDNFKGNFFKINYSFEKMYTEFLENKDRKKLSEVKNASEVEIKVLGELYKNGEERALILPTNFDKLCPKGLNEKQLNLLCFLLGRDYEDIAENSYTFDELCRLTCVSPKNIIDDLNKVYEKILQFAKENNETPAFAKFEIDTENKILTYLKVSESSLVIFKPNEDFKDPDNYIRFYNSEFIKIKGTVKKRFYFIMQQFIKTGFIKRTMADLIDSLDMSKNHFFSTFVEKAIKPILDYFSIFGLRLTKNVKNCKNFFEFVFKAYKPEASEANFKKQSQLEEKVVKELKELQRKEGEKLTLGTFVNYFTQNFFKPLKLSRTLKNRIGEMCSELSRSKVHFEIS